MKATYLTATIISMMYAMPCGAATSELETLRERCQQQEQRISQLEKQLKQLGAQPNEQKKSAGESSAALEGDSGRSYTVQAGDNVDKIARRSGCSVRALNALNNLQEKTVIFPGQKLKLPEKSRPISTDAARVNEPAAPTRGVSKTHTIQQGETYTSISRKYKIPVNTLVSLNPEVKATALRPGLKIRLNEPKADTTAEAGDVAVAKAETPKRSEAPSASAEEVKPKNSTVTKSDKAQTPPTVHAPAQTEKDTPPPLVESDPKPDKRIRPVKIEEPMTYGEFASKHGTTPERLNHLNGLDLTQSTVLAKGSELYVPAQP